MAKKINKKSPKKGSKSRAEKLLPCHKVIQNILWNPQYQANAFTVVYIDRVKGDKNIPLPEFMKKDDILWHRVKQLRIAGFIVWDREERLDAITGSGASLKPDTAGIAGAIKEWEASREVPAPMETQTIPALEKNSFRWNSRKAAWIETPAYEIPEEVNSFTILTFNVLFDTFEKEKIYSEKRRKALFEKLKETRADLIALQEVTPAFLEKLLDQPWIREHYWIAGSPGGESVTPYGQILLSRYPIEGRYYPFTEHKGLIVGELQFNEATLLVPVLHLTSNRSKKGPEKRKKEISRISDIIEERKKALFPRKTTALWVGDFNSEPGESGGQPETSGLHDFWPALYPGKAGCTFDPLENPLAKLMSLTGVPRRLDRILIPAGDQSFMEGLEIQLWGNTPFETTSAGTPLYLSDHYGLFALFQFREQKDVVKRELSQADATVRSALVWIPRQQDSIQAIRKTNDPSYTRWMPHVNLLYPFLEEKTFKKSLPVLREILKNYTPFRLTLKEFGVFHHRSSSTIWLKPEPSNPIEFRQLQKELQELFPQCGRDDIAWQPHLTVAKLSGSNETIQKQKEEWSRNRRATECEVGELSLISRREDQPFEVRYRLPLGKEVIREDKKESVLRFLKSELPRQFSRGKNKNIYILPVGSYNLGNSGPESDLDLLCLGPPEISRKDFFKTAVKLLQEKQGSVKKRLVEDAVVPVLKVKVKGIALDFQYASFPPGIPVVHPRDIPPEELILSEKESRWALLGYYDWQALLSYVKQNGGVKRFSEGLKRIKKWTRLRGLGFSGFGFPGSFSITIMFSRILQEVSPVADTDELVYMFFDFYSRWPFNQPITYNGEEVSFEMKHRWDHLMAVLSPAPPYRNTTRGITVSTRRVLKEEIIRALKLLQKGKKPEETIATVNSLKNHPYYILIETSGNSTEEGSSWVEGHLVGFLVKIEKALSGRSFGISPARPYPWLFASDNPFYLIGLNPPTRDMDRRALKEKLKDAFTVFESDFRLYRGVCDPERLTVKIVSQKELVELNPQKRKRL